MIEAGEILKNRDRVKALFFKKDAYTIEGIIRWMIDRKFNYDNFRETDSFYIFRQAGCGDYEQSIYETIENYNIGVEFGVDTGGKEPGLENPGEFSEL